MEQPSKHSLDLPLMANIDDIQVQHYVLDLLCDMEAKMFTGYVILICRPTEKWRFGENIELTESVEIYSRNCDREITRECQTAMSENSPTAATNMTKPDVQQVTTCVNVKDTVVKTTAAGILITEDTSDMQSSSCKLTNEPQELLDHTYQLKPMDIQHTLCSSSAGCSNSGQEQHCSKSMNFQHIDTYSKSEFCSDSNGLCMILDSWDIYVHQVTFIDIPYHLLNEYDSETGKCHSKQNLKQELNGLMEQPLDFLCNKTYLKIWKPGLSSVQDFPRAVKIYYKTKLEGPSLKWTLDQDGRPCVYTHGHWVNNRSLFPSQDVPTALATWDAAIHVPDGMVALMSGDQNATVIRENGLCTFRYITNLEVPSSTLALAVGHWKQVTLVAENPPATQLPCRLFTAEKYLHQASHLIGQYIPGCMEAACSLLGPYPFRRLDILIVPSSFNSLGMASPSLMFLSQSILSEDGHMLIRVAHELSHSWFGLSIGPRDWHEEWLSEGFCTYTEAVIHAGARKKSYEKFNAEREIFDYLKFKTLSAELQSTGPELQTLRSRTGDSADRQKYVCNGMNPDKGFLQLHYLKGYFLLRFLEDRVGTENFHCFLRRLVETFLHTLIDSKDVLQLYFEMFPDQSKDDFCEDHIVKEWLNAPGLPKMPEPNLEHCRLAEPVLNMVKDFKDYNSLLTALHWRKRRKVDLKAHISFSSILCVPQALLLLDKLLEENKIRPEIFDLLNDQLKLSTANPDVRHKCCELVVKNKYEKWYKDVKYFLVNDQAMGVYLFGELIISRDKGQRKLAEDCYKIIAPDMEDGVKKIVRAMIYGD